MRLHYEQTPTKTVNYWKYGFQPYYCGGRYWLYKLNRRTNTNRRQFNYKNVLVNLARINLFFQRIEDLTDEEILKQAFCPPFLVGYN